MKDFPNGPEGYEILMELSVDADLLKTHEFGGLDGPTAEGRRN